MVNAIFAHAALFFRQKNNYILIKISENKLLFSLEHIVYMLIKTRDIY